MILLLLVAAVAAEPTLLGEIRDPTLPEISGLAPSRIHGDRLWVVNDNGHPADLTQIDFTGATRGRVRLQGVTNRDWEDLDSFEWEGRPYLIVADTGDNDAKYPEYFLYIVPEPAALTGNGTATVARTLRFRYPDDARLDCESMAVDVSQGAVYLFSKRGFPSVLYQVDLHDERLQRARRLADIRSIPQPTPADIEADPHMGRWIGQPTAAALDSRGVVLLTYRHAYWYPRSSDETWADAMTGTPTEIPLPRLVNGEAIALLGDSVVVTSEQLPAPLIKVPLPSP